MRSHLNCNFLPKDPRTLLSTPRYSKIRDLGLGKFYYFSIQAILERCFLHGCLNDKTNLTISIGVDGLPISKSSRSQFWPIICIIDQSSCKLPGVVALYYGLTKPSSFAEFFKELCEELKGFQIGVDLWDKKWTLSVRCIIADAPARSFLKQCCPYNAYFGCERCTQKGKWLGKVTFQELDSNLRTDESFKLQHQRQHHQDCSPFLDLGIGLVSQVPIDMHLVCLGVVRR